MTEVPIRIRPAEAQDDPLIVTLVHLTMGRELDWLFGQKPGLSPEQVVAALVARRGNRFSRQLCWIAELRGGGAGLLLAFPGRRIARLELRTGMHLVRIFGLAATLRVAALLSAYGSLVETKADEFYISHLGVLPAFQGQGIGARLLAFADSLARSAGLGKCSLLVTQDNPAVRLYQRSGYGIDAEYAVADANIAHGTGFYRMLKTIQA